MSLLRQIEELMYQEENYWWQRSRIAWLTSGDRNSKFFHLTTVIRRTRNAILSIKDGNGLWTRDKKVINHMFTDYFTNLFSSSGPRHLEKALDSIEVRIDDDVNKSLLRPVTAEEIRSATFELRGSKAPGPDGFPGKFYQSSWNEIGNEESARVWQDNWILSMLPRHLQTDNETLKKSGQPVATLISNATRSWNLHQVRHLIDDPTASAIAAIPLPSTPIGDKLVWALANNGLYTIKLGYHLTHSSSPSNDQSVGSLVSMTSAI
ncbi:hypothetical protein K1719_016963 [Acacia pycnantha]|nr:hypothetical protein K1719_016963 [Acacia pycnantha]